MNAAIYIRVSTDDQAEHGYSLDEQVHKCEQKAKELGVDDTHVFRDEGISGAIVDRPGLTALRDAVRTGAYSYVLMTRPDRLARNLAIQLSVADEIASRCELVFTDEAFEKTPEGRAFFQFRGVIGELEKALINQRMSDGRRAKARKGLMPMGPRPYGYDYDPEESALVINETEASVVRRMYDMMVNQGLGLNGIAKRLTAEGVPTKRGASEWSRMVVKQIISNRIYIGDFVYGRSSHHDVYLNKSRKNGDKIKPKPRPEKEWIHVAVPRIVDDQVWFQAQDYLSQARRRVERQSKSPYLLSGLVRCGQCGETMPGTRKKNWGTLVRYYTCYRSSAGSRPSCGQWVKADDLEQVVWATVSGEILKADVEPPEPPKVDEVAAIDAMIGKDEQAKQRLIRALTIGAVSEDDIIDNLKQINDRIAAQKARRESLLRSQREEHAWDDLVAACRAEFATLDPATLSIDHQKRLLKQLVHEIVVYPSGEVSIDIRGIGKADIPAQDQEVESRFYLHCLLSGKPLHR